MECGTDYLWIQGEKQKGKISRLEGINYRSGQRLLSKLILMPGFFFFLFNEILLLKTGRNSLNENLNSDVKTHALITWFNKNPVRKIAHMQVRSWGTKICEM